MSLPPLLELQFISSTVFDIYVTLPSSPPVPVAGLALSQSLSACACCSFGLFRVNSPSLNSTCGQLSITQPSHLHRGMCFFPSFLFSINTGMLHINAANTATHSIFFLYALCSSRDLLSLFTKFKCFGHFP